MTKVTRYRFIQSNVGVAGFVGQFDPESHVELAENPFWALTDIPGQDRPKHIFLIECPGLTRKSVFALQLLLQHLTAEPETQLSLGLHIVTVEIEKEDDHILTDHYYVVTTNTKKGRSLTPPSKHCSSVKAACSDIPSASTTYCSPKVACCPNDSATTTASGTICNTANRLETFQQREYPFALLFARAKKKDHANVVFGCMRHRLGGVFVGGRKAFYFTSPL